MLSFEFLNKIVIFMTWKDFDFIDLKSQAPSFDSEYDTWFGRLWYVKADMIPLSLTCGQLLIVRWDLRWSKSIVLASIGWLISLR